MPVHACSRRVSDAVLMKSLLNFNDMENDNWSLDVGRGISRVKNAWGELVSKRPFWLWRRNTRKPRRGWTLALIDFRKLGFRTPCCKSWGHTWSSFVNAESTAPENAINSRAKNCTTIVVVLGSSEFLSEQTNRFVHRNEQEVRGTFCLNQFYFHLKWPQSGRSPRLSLTLIPCRCFIIPACSLQCQSQLLLLCALSYVGFSIIFVSFLSLSSIFVFYQGLSSMNVFMSHLIFIPWAVFCWLDSIVTRSIKYFGSVFRLSINEISG